MPRDSRREHPGALHHVTAKSPSRRLLFEQDGDRQRYLRLLAGEIRKREWRLLSFCLLSNHLHLLIQTPEPDLGAGMKSVHEEFARRTNRARGESGHLFGARFYNGLVRSDRHAIGCLRYIARNPIEAGICREPAQWPWSAHAALAGLTDAPAFLDVAAAYEHLGRDADEARANYLRLVAKSNEVLLADLVRPGADDWIATAHHDFAIPISDLVSFLAVSKDTVYRRLRSADATQGSVPSVATQGSVPSVA